MRYKFLRWLNCRIFKTKEGEIAPKFVQFVYRVLFPLNWFYQKQSGMRYDPLTDVYFIRGMRFTSQVFDTLRDMAKVGHKFELVETDGEVCTIRSLSEK